MTMKGIPRGGELPLKKLSSQEESNRRESRKRGEAEKKTESAREF